MRYICDESAKQPNIRKLQCLNSAVLFWLVQALKTVISGRGCCIRATISCVVSDVIDSSGTRARERKGLGSSHWRYPPGSLPAKLVSQLHFVRCIAFGIRDSKATVKDSLRWDIMILTQKRHQVPKQYLYISNLLSVLSNRTLTMPYVPKHSCGKGLNASCARKWTLAGNHACGGCCSGEMSKPSSVAETGSVWEVRLARSWFQCISQQSVFVTCDSRKMEGGHGFCTLSQCRCLQSAS